MVFIEWENKKLLQLETYSFSTQLAFTNKSCEIFIDTESKDTDLPKYFQSWESDIDSGMEWRDLILFDTKRGKYFLILSAKPIILHTNNQGFMSSCKLRIDTIEEITRHVKILKFLK